MKLFLLFLVTSIGGGVGKLLGLLIGAALSPGVGILLQFVIGGALLVVAVLFAERARLIQGYQRRWTIIGGALGVGMSTLVTLSTLYSPIAPWVIPAIIGMGAALASLIGKSAHERPDLT